MKKLVLLGLALGLLLSGCGTAAPQPEETATEPPVETTAAPTPEPEPTPVQLNILDDHWRNWYEVFVYSYADSDGDGIGDFNGLAGKLDYIQDLGCNGIWLMPIMPSPSYHKYDVTNYYDVDPQYGTLEDFRALVAECHAREIRVIIDLPVNHSSSRHPWFLEALEDPESPYREFYNWSDTAKNGYTYKNGVYYESRFVDSMPDLNLDSPAVREEIKYIMAFWLGDVGVDGFRLDAVTSYYTGQVDKNVEFLDWLGSTAREVAPDCFLVGEVWENLGIIAQYAEGGIDSCFLFPAAQSSGFIARALSNTAAEPGNLYASAVRETEETLPGNTIPAPFTENHDTPRTAGFTGRSDPEKTKMAGGLLAMLRGGVFLYYGQEIGMVGSGEDPNKRIGMLWTTPEETTAPPLGATKVEYAYPSVAEQEADPDSILSYYRAALELRNRFPEIARGNSEILDSGDPDLCLIRRTWEGRSLLIAINPSRNDHDCHLTGDAGAFTVLSAALCAGEGEVTLENGTLTLPHYAIAILELP